MNEQNEPVQNVALAFHEASDALEAAVAALKPYAEQQITIIKGVLTENNLCESLKYRGFFSYDYFEFDYGPPYDGTQDVPAVACKLWRSGYRSATDSMVHIFTLNRHIVNSEPEKFEAELRAELLPEMQNRAHAEREMKERQVAQLRADLAKLEDALK